LIAGPRSRRFAREHPILSLVASRALLGLITLFFVSVIVFAATQVLPGNAAYAVLGRSATPERLAALEAQLHLDESVLGQYWRWLSGVLTGDFGTSLGTGQSVWSIVEPRLVNSAVIVLAAGAIGSLVAVVLGAFAALRRDRPFDHALALVSLVVTALPEFLIAIGLVIVFSTLVWHLLPAVSIVPPGAHAWSDPELLILPVATLVIVVVPYISRMTRAATVEALTSEYVEMARLTGARSRRVLFVQALPNAVAPTIQVIGLSLLYLAGGIVVVEYVFAYPGIGQGLVNAVTDRDIPVIQFTVLVLAAFYVVVNILADVVALLASPRRRFPR
jgi:peptide/nickel transport system permease protein